MEHLSLPDQAYGALGAELVALAVITGGGLLMLNRRVKLDTGTAATHAIALILKTVASNAVTAILLSVAGLLILFGVHAGLYVLVVPVFVGLAGGVASAWLLLTRIT